MQGGIFNRVCGCCMVLLMTGFAKLFLNFTGVTKNCVLFCPECTVKAYIQYEMPSSDKEVKNILKMRYEYFCLSRLAYGRVKTRSPYRSGTRPSISLIKETYM